MPTELPIEAEVADLKRRLPPKTNWVEEIIGSITDTEAFDEVLALGREMRQAGRPTDEEA